MRIVAFFALVALFVAGLTTTRISMPAMAEECDPNYLGACVPNNATGITCDKIKAQVTVAHVDVHNLDHDKDGTACESYAKSSGTGSRSSTAGAGTAPVSKTPGAANGQASEGGDTCSTVFVAGKGVIDSCSQERSANSRVYPRKPGVPANGCVNTCPEVSETAKTPGTGDTTKPSGTPTRAVSTPIASEYTPPMDLGVTPEAPQNCDRVSYPDVCVPAAPPYLSCSDIPDRNFRVRAPDPHRFDADGNGIGCEQVAGPTIGR